MAVVEEVEGQGGWVGLLEVQRQVGLPLPVRRGPLMDLGTMSRK